MPRERKSAQPSMPCHFPCFFCAKLMSHQATAAGAGQRRHASTPQEHGPAGRLLSIEARSAVALSDVDASDGNAASTARRPGLLLLFIRTELRRPPPGWGVDCTSDGAVGGGRWTAASAGRGGAGAGPANRQLQNRFIGLSVCGNEQCMTRQPSHPSLGSWGCEPSAMSRHRLNVAQRGSGAAGTPHSVYDGCRMQFLEFQRDKSSF